MIQFIVFSRKRPLQLYGYLESLFYNISDQVAVGVLIRTDPEYASAYNTVRDRFPYVHFIEETDFNKNIHTFLNRTAAEYVCFGCDDVVFTGTIKPDDINDTFQELPLIGLTLRLGRNVSVGMFGNPMTLPMFTSTETHKLVWNVQQASSVGDWAYPWEVLGTVYPIAFVRHMLNQILPSNPSQLEAMGAATWHQATNLRTMASYPTSRFVVPTVNIVQTEYPGNGVLGPTALSPEFLLDCWNNGLRLNTQAFARQPHDSWRIRNFYLKRD